MDTDLLRLVRRVKQAEENEFSKSGGAVAGDVTVNGNLTTDGDVAVSGGLTAAGNVAVNGSLTTDGDAALGGELTAAGNVTVGGSLTTDGDTTLGGELTTDGNVALGGELTTAGDVDVGGELTTDGSISVGGGLTTTGDVDVGGRLTTDGNVALGGGLTTNGSISVTGNLTTGGNMLINSGDGSYRSLKLVRGDGTLIFEQSPPGSGQLRYLDNNITKGAIRFNANQVPYYSPDGSNYYPMWHNGNMPYETGSWSPTVYGTSTPGNPTCSALGRYVRIGDMVQAYFYVSMSSKGTMAGSVRVGGLPIATNQMTSTIRQWAFGSGITVTNLASLAFLIPTADTYLMMRAVTISSGTISDRNLDASEINNSTKLAGTAIYRVTTQGGRYGNDNN